MSSQLVDLVDFTELPGLSPSPDFILPARTTKKRQAPAEEPEKRLSKRARKKIAQLERKNKLKERESQVKPLLRSQRLGADQAKKLELLQRLSDPKLTSRRFLGLFAVLQELGVCIPPPLADRASSLKAKYESNAAKQKTKAAALIPAARHAATPRSEASPASVPSIAVPPVETSPVETSPAETSPAATPPAETSPVETSPVETSPAETSPAATPPAAVPSNSDAVTKEAPNVKAVDKPPPRPWLHLLQKPDVLRPVGIELGRLRLPACLMEQEIVDACLYNLVTLITGDTGCGKSTQLPQFLYEAGFCMSYSPPIHVSSKRIISRSRIAVTQPRRVATVAVANRLREELGPHHGAYVCHQFRGQFEGGAGDPRIHVLTDGILLKILEGDMLLTHYSVVVLDEVHERSLNSDLLLGILSRIVLERQRLWQCGSLNIPPLRLVLMSATMRLDDFLSNSMLFATTPAKIHIDARTHKVVCHFSRRTPEDYLSEAKRRILQIHTRLPAGSILVFLTGKREILELKEKLQGKMKSPNKLNYKFVCDAEDIDDATMEMPEPVWPEEAYADFDEVSETECSEIYSNRNENRPVFALSGTDPDPSDHDPDCLANQHTETAHEWLGCGFGKGNLTIRTLYANGPRGQQDLAFQYPKQGERVVILATNVAETSITLPNIRYVVDSGFEKQRIFKSGGISSSYKVCQISKANASQRAGRAGRVGPGHCYRLYSSAVFEHEFAQYPPVEMTRAPLDKVLLYLINIGIPDPKLFPFPSRPNSMDLEAALNRLTALNLVVSGKRSNSNLRLTPDGTAAARFPLHPRLGRSVARSIVYGRHGRNLAVIPLVVLAAAGLEMGNEAATHWFEPEADSLFMEQFFRKTWVPVDDCDFMMAILWYFCRHDSEARREKECQRYHFNSLRVKEAVAVAYTTMNVIRNHILTNSERDELDEKLNLNAAWAMSPYEEVMKCFSRINKPGAAARQAVRRLITMGMADQVAVRWRKLSKAAPKEGSMPKSELKKLRKGYKASGVGMKDYLALIGTKSIVFRQPQWPDLVCYTTVTETASGHQLTELIVIDTPSQLQKYSPSDSVLFDYLRIYQQMA